MSKPTKYYSSLQERTIAEFFGWKTVAASGARPFNPGDIKSPRWLAECKTHTDEVERVVISKSVWQKLTNEARSVRKTPILFIDNGTQKIENTWAVLPAKCLEGKEFEVVDGPFRISDRQITFRHNDMKNLFRRKRASTALSINSDTLYLVRALDIQEIVGDV